MSARIVYGGAAALLVCALLGVRSAGQSSYAIWIEDSLPLLIHEPDAATSRDGERLPVVVLSHGSLGNSSLLNSLARRLSAQGFAVITFDSRGQGRSRRPFERSVGFVPEGLIEDFDQAVLWARSQARYDGQRLAVGGHGTGAAGALAYAARRDPGVAAVVAISGSASLDGPYTPPNVLLLWGERAPSALRALSRRRGAELISANRAVLERTYGSFERGTAVRLAEVEGANHLSVLYAQGAASEISSWLAGALTPTPDLGPVPRDTSLLWALVGMLGALALLLGMPQAVAPLAPRVALPAVTHPWQRLGLVAAALAASTVLLVGADQVAGSAPLAVFPLSGARDVLGFFAIAGVGLLAYAARDTRVRAEGLRDWRTWTSAGLILGFIYVSIGVLSQPFWDPLLSSRRLLPWAAATLLLLPWFGVTEWLLRGPLLAQAWLPAAARLLTLAALASAAFFGLVPRALLAALVPLVLLFAIFEALAFRLSRQLPNPWLSALVQSAWFAWLLAAFFPIEG